MSTSTTTLNGNSVTLVALPASPGLRSVEFSIDDAVSAFSVAGTAVLTFSVRVPVGCSPIR